ncbi:MAG TPA: hypothetical protein VFL82_11895 [Thermomicrobiales bacterium]|nr:hypothetical protein [Thermomicrobiales bacterium]
MPHNDQDEFEKVVREGPTDEQFAKAAEETPAGRETEIPNLVGGTFSAGIHNASEADAIAGEPNADAHDRLIGGGSERPKQNER